MQRSLAQSSGFTAVDLKESIGGSLDFLGSWTMGGGRSREAADRSIVKIRSSPTRIGRERRKRGLAITILLYRAKKNSRRGTGRLPTQYSCGKNRYFRTKISRKKSRRPKVVWKKNPDEARKECGGKRSDGSGNPTAPNLCIRRRAEKSKRSPGVVVPYSVGEDRKGFAR